MGRWQDAWKVVESAYARDFHPRSATMGSSFFWAMKVPEVAARAGRYKEAESMARDSLAYFEPLEVPAGIGAANFALSLALAGQKEWQKALSSYEKALPDFQSLNQPFDSANTQFEMGLVYLNSGEGHDFELAHQCLTNAKRIYIDIKANPDIDKTQKLLSAVPEVETGAQ